MVMGHLDEDYSFVHCATDEEKGRTYLEKQH